jgi:hypothetical protein
MLANFGACIYNRDRPQLWTKIPHEFNYSMIVFLDCLDNALVVWPVSPFQEHRLREGSPTD